jgi:ABC-2 type transport system ATP-binding protein
MEAVRVENLTKSFGSHKVLDRLSFQVETGTICGFIGPNGSGKTTTIRILLGLLKKGGGRVQVLGEDVEFGKESQVKARIAFLQQDPVFPERHTGREVMDLVARLYGMESSYARQRTDELLNEFHLEKAANRSAAVYSKGMKQRLGLAACFLPDPQLLILDEPVSALDPEGRVEVFDIIRRVKGKSTVLFSSHILEDVERVSDTLVMIKEGQKVLEGTIEEIFTQYGAERLRIVFREGDSGRGMDILRAMPWAERVVAGSEPGEVFVNVRQGMMDRALDESLGALVCGGLRVTAFGRSRTDLESLFLHLSANSRESDTR